MKLKDPTTYDEQVDLLRQKNIKISDEYSCVSFLSKVNYYRLSGYFLPFKNKDEKKCFTPIDFNRIQNIYAFDTELRNLFKTN